MTPTTHEQVSAPPGGSQGGQGGLTEAARDEAGHLKDTALEATQQVAGTAKDKATDVASDVRQQTQRLVSETRDQVTQQAGQQRDRAVEGLRSVGEELRGMAEHGQSGWGAQLARQGAELTDQAADFLQNRGAGDILDEVRTIARKRPGTFLLVAAAAGVAAGRFSRAMAAGKGMGSDGSRSISTGAMPPATSTGMPYTGTGAPYTGTAGTGFPSGSSPATTGGLGTAGTGTGEPLAGRTNGLDDVPPPPDDYLTEPPPPTPTPTAPDPDPGAPVEPRFGPGTGR